MTSRFVGRVLAVILILVIAGMTSACEGSVGVGVSVGYPYGGYTGSGPWGPTTITGGPIWR